MNTKTKSCPVTFAVAVRTCMCGGGTAYDVYFRTKDKPSRPLHNGHCYATEIVRDGIHYYPVADAIDPKPRWSMDAGMEKWNAGEKLRRVASRLALRIAKRAFPELRGARKLPDLWAGWTLPSEEKLVAVKVALPA